MTDADIHKLAVAIALESAKLNLKIGFCLFCLAIAGFAFYLFHRK